MFTNLLVPLDGTPQSNVALPFARMLAATCQGRLILVRVVDPAVLSPAEFATQPPLVLGQLNCIADELRQAGAVVDVRVSTGGVAAEILKVAEAERADALIVVTHASTLERLVDNSTANALIARSRVPVFVLRPGRRRIRSVRTVLVPVDGSPGGAQALDEAVGLARLTGAALVVVRVISRPGHFRFEPLLATTPGAQAQALGAAEAYVNEIARKLRAHGLEARPRVMVGSPAERIVAAADQLNADIIVMSTHGYQVPLRTVLGNTAHAVVRAAGRPVLLVRRTDGAAPPPRQAKRSYAESIVSVDSRRPPAWRT